MRIPIKYQIFPVPVEISPSRKKVLEAALSSWSDLFDFLHGSTIRVTDLRRLVILELMGKKRYFMLTRILQRMAREERNRLEKCIGVLLS